MTPYSMALIGLRLIIVFVVFQTIADSVSWSVAAKIQPDEEIVWQTIAWALVTTVTLKLLIAAAFWLLTPRVARFLVSGQDRDRGAFSIEARQVLAVLLAAIGAYHFIWAFPAFVMTLFRMLEVEPDYPQQENLPQLLEYGVVTLLAILFMFKGHRVATWVSLLSRRRE